MRSNASRSEQNSRVVLAEHHRQGKMREQIEQLAVAGEPLVSYAIDHGEPIEFRTRGRRISSRDAPLRSVEHRQAVRGERRRLVVARRREPSACQGFVINQCQPWSMGQDDRLFTALAILAGIGSTALLAIALVL